MIPLFSPNLPYIPVKIIIHRDHTMLRVSYDNRGQNRDERFPEFVLTWQEVVGKPRVMAFQMVYQGLVYTRRIRTNRRYS